MSIKATVSFGLAVGALTTALAAEAATGACDANPPTSSLACINAVQSAGGVVHDIFKDKNGLTGPQLPLFAKFFNNWPGCDTTSHNGCAGESTPPYDCPGVYSCNGTVTNTVANATKYLEKLDHLWWHPCRLLDHTLTNGCPNRAVSNCVTDGTPGHYFPWEGLVFDLGGPSNKVAIFAQNDHGPQPCESIEYTVYLTDNPLAKDAVEDPATTGTDPQKWNRAVLQQIFTHGWFTTRPPSPGNPTWAACGDTANYAVEDDSFTQVHGLPCGITFRYASIVAGYDGKEFPACSYHSQEGEVDAVAGLTEQGTGVCPDADKDGFVDCKCPGATQPCDCNDADAKTYPGAPEPCDSSGDLDCDGKPGACPSGLFCNASICVPPCKAGEIGNCPIGSTCQTTDQGAICVPDDCTTGGCPPGSVCDATSKKCKPACDGVVCPFGQSCKDGKCVDLCAGVQCPPPKQCSLGECKAPCSCYAGDIGCSAGEICDKTGSKDCVPPACKGKTCQTGEHCDTTGACVGLCSGVTCPQGQKCDSAKGCVPLCEGVTCATGEECDAKTGACVPAQCTPICFPPKKCVAGQCVLPEAGTGGAANDAGSDAGGGTGGKLPSGGTTDSDDDGGCGCRAPAATAAWPAALLGLLGALGLSFWRRRRR
ncbi:MAG: putative metal-binding motif-containing protein [Polyangiaceae bacterium]|nr:putative metal-binding motif-containing protein [Polyangiaceae bacterium]